MINPKECFGCCICLEVVIQVFLMLGSNSTLGKEPMWTVPYSNICRDTALREKQTFNYFPSFSSDSTYRAGRIHGSETAKTKSVVI